MQERGLTSAVHGHRSCTSTPYPQYTLTPHRHYTPTPHPHYTSTPHPHYTSTPHPHYTPTLHTPTTHLHHTPTTHPLYTLTLHIYTTPPLHTYPTPTERLPYSIRVLLESAVRNWDGFQVSQEDVTHILNWDQNQDKAVEIPFHPARVILQDFTYVGFPFQCIVCTPFHYQSADHSTCSVNSRNLLLPVPLLSPGSPPLLHYIQRCSCRGGLRCHA